jgi:flagellar biogenesis protein FliO
MIVLLLCILALAGVAWLNRTVALPWTRGGLKRSSRRQISVEERVSLTPQHTIHVIRCASTRLVVATTPSGLVVLDTSERGSNATTAAYREQPAIK